jgi:hypothetical protein
VDPDQEIDVDWRDAEAYAPLLDADRSIFAWEWLRRDPGYRAAVKAARPGGQAAHEPPRPEFFGLHAFEDPFLAAPDARPVWTAQIHPFVLPAVAAPGGAISEAFDLRRLQSLATLLSGRAGREHLLLSDGLRTVRLDIVAGTAAAGPVELRYLISGIVSAERAILSLRRLIAVHEARGFGRALQGRETRARRRLLALRASDGLAAGADQREIASVLLSAAARRPRWRSNASSVRSQVQRLVRGARMMAAGGYRDLLR